MSRLRDGGGGGSSGSHCSSVCLYSPSIAGQLWHFRVTAAGTSGKSSARNRGAGSEQKQLVFWEEGKETLVVVKSWSSTHRLSWEQGSEVPPKAAEGLNQPRSWGDIALGSWVLVCWSHTLLPVWDPPGSLSQALEVGAGQPSPALLPADLAHRGEQAEHVNASRGLQNTSLGLLGGRNAACFVQVPGIAWLLQERVRRCVSLTQPLDGVQATGASQPPRAPPNNAKGDRGLGDRPQPCLGSDHAPVVLIPAPSWMWAEDISP